VWVTNSGSAQDPAAEGARGSVMRFDRATFGDPAAAPKVLDVGRQPRNLWQGPDGAIWVTVWGDDRVVRLDPATGNEVAGYCTGPGSHPNGIGGDEVGRVWVVTEGDGRLHAIDAGAKPAKPCPAGA
jgi:streptogramin lyase